ncbi:MAG TPA: phosphoadenylyl-sulfate reductase [Xanthobacteraceae bacterium]
MRSFSADDYPAPPPREAAASARIELDTRALAAALDRWLAGAQPADILSQAVRLVGRERLAVVSSFGTESAALLKIVADVDPAIPVVLLDTGWLFAETLAYRDLLVEKLKLAEVRTIRPDPAALAERDPRGDLWLSDADACCRLRKVEPLERALQPFDAWVNGRKRYQDGERTALPVVEADGWRLKFNPLARASAAEVAAIFAAAGLPSHPLAAAGFSSVGCLPCTRRSPPGEAPRAGRWDGSAKTECGIHTPR